MAFLAMLVPYIPVLLSIVSFVMKLFGASDKKIKEFEEMVQKNKDAGNVVVTNYETLNQFDQEMEKEANDKLQPKQTPDRPSP